jgi:hypothetical protein
MALVHSTSKFYTHDLGTEALCSLIDDGRILKKTQIEIYKIYNVLLHSLPDTPRKMDFPQPVLWLTFTFKVTDHTNY